MPVIYLDNASTSFPKPQVVADAMYNFITQQGYNVNRSSASGAYSVADAVYSTRQLLCRLFQAEDCKNVVFTKNITEALNIVLKELLQPGDHVLVSSLEHNAVMRPLLQMGAQELSLTLTEAHPVASSSLQAASLQPAPSRPALAFTRIPCTATGDLCLDTLPQLLQPNTKAIILTHASNVCGTLQPLAEVGSFCHQHGLKFIVDSAQTAGLFPLAMQDLHIDALCFTGHKSLLGPQGIGGFILKESMVDQIAPLLTGGTGSLSHTELQPSFMPDKFEAGTLNLPGIIGLKAALEWLTTQGMDKLRQHELQLTERFLAGLQQLEQRHLLRIIGHKHVYGHSPVSTIVTTHNSSTTSTTTTMETNNFPNPLTLATLQGAESLANNTTQAPILRTSVVSITTDMMDIAQLAYLLDTRYHLATRVGLHCAPHAHKALGTFPTGTLRFSCGWHTTPAEIDTALQALEEVLTHGL